MKTKQEQIKAMAEDIKRCFEKNSTLDFEQLAERLVQAGYGNVSEYKDNEVAIVAFCNQTVRDISTKKDVEINQAQIDVLNIVKDILANQEHECLERNNLVGYSAISVCEEYINGLIKELEDEN